MNEVKIIAGAMLEKKAQDVRSMDLRKLGNTICDFFVICNADSGIQVAAIADQVEEQMFLKAGRHVRRSQGKENRFWVILDYSDIVVHIFQTEYRRFYRLEDLWADAETQHYND
ncbi:MAG TPA: ribosome silencing factor [Bacteroidales bacterium]|nr:MAG: Ribosomal silencing factor RsfS [Bacteroidetes bacterium ADurb.Bin037]HPV88179.1 ribosome silencing factor [Bacteroidales bacterium]HPW77742.1 ribosome silencing factor [Bacteroidales bacterium]HQB55451.1 ribosome silencing factor [Bacteroidales bacterium]